MLGLKKKRETNSYKRSNALRCKMQDAPGERERREEVRAWDGEDGRRLYQMRTQSKRSGVDP